MCSRSRAKPIRLSAARPETRRATAISSRMVSWAICTSHRGSPGSTSRASTWEKSGPGPATAATTDNRTDSSHAACRSNSTNNSRRSAAGIRVGSTAVNTANDAAHGRSAAEAESATAGHTTPGGDTTPEAGHAGPRSGSDSVADMGRVYPIIRTYVRTFPQVSRRVPRANSHRTTVAGTVGNTRLGRRDDH